ncbi:hypothetical protein CYMTET_44622 [Cymbomonas tetramitiformis]|uniref:Uncharacterized protein n=1 Tax=Cymbomonas tetramitiformis TaxID=36881 RepID=A0AAE0BZT6_9CHLO|nr:hypothetical protein CYMTET_44622 [Cymbomonas tetramitiformis]
MSVEDLTVSYMTLATQRLKTYATKKEQLKYISNLLFDAFETMHENETLEYIDTDNVIIDGAIDVERLPACFDAFDILRLLTKILIDIDTHNTTLNFNAYQWIVFKIQNPTLFLPSSSLIAGITRAKYDDVHKRQEILRHWFDCHGIILWSDLGCIHDRRFGQARSDEAQRNLNMFSSDTVLESEFFRLLLRFIQKVNQIELPFI